MSAAHIQEDEDNSTSPLDLIMESTHGSTRDNAHQLITIPAEEQRALNSPKDQFWSKAVEKLRKNKNVELSITEGQGMTEFKVVMKGVTYCEGNHTLNPGDESVDKRDGLPPMQTHVDKKVMGLAPETKTGPEGDPLGIKGIKEELGEGRRGQKRRAVEINGENQFMKKCARPNNTSRLQEDQDMTSEGEEFWSDDDIEHNELISSHNISINGMNALGGCMQCGHDGSRGQQSRDSCG